jgi:hypothetical protein
MNTPIRFSSLARFLTGLGCQRTTVPGAHVAFEHVRSGALIVLRPYTDDEAVSPTDLAVARRTLDEFGVIARDQFDALLRDEALAG